MAIVKMKKLAFSVYDNIREQVLTEIQKAGCFHLESVTEEIPEAIEGEETFAASLVPVLTDSREQETFAAELEDAIEFLTDFVPPVKMGMIEKMAQTKPAVSVREMIQEYDKFDIPLLIKDVHNLKRNFKDADSRLQTLQKEMDDLTQWESSGLDLDLVNGKSSFLCAATGYVSLANAPGFAERMNASSPYLEVIETFSTTKETYYYIIYLRSESDSIIEKLKEEGFAAIPISQRTGSVRTAIAEIRKEIEVQTFRREFERVLVGGMLAQLDTLKIVYDYIKILQTRDEALNLGVKTEKVSFYKGWIPAECEEGVRRILNRFSEIDFTLEDPAEDEIESVPVLMETRPAFKPFRFLTNMFGTPMYNNIDPTAHLSPFYIVFFGFCFADIAYGLILFLATTYIAVRAKKNKTLSNTMKLFALAGLSTMLFGFIFKSCLGDLFCNPAYPTYVASFAKLWSIDTMKNPMLTLFIALNLGAVHLLYGLLINFIHEFKQNKLESIMTNLSWMIFIIGFFGWALYSWMAGLAGITPLPPVGVKVVLGIMLVGVAFIIVNAIRIAKHTVGGVIVGFLGGLYRVYGVSSYVSDLLSYARLLALGLSGSVISNVFNSLGFMVFDGVPVKAVGFVGLFAILAFGHVFNFVLSAFGAFVHSLRLQFVEFFSKFLKSGGKSYEPLREEGMFHDIKTEQN